MWTGAPSNRFSMSVQAIIFLFQQKPFKYTISAVSAPTQENVLFVGLIKAWKICFRGFIKKDFLQFVRPVSITFCFFPLPFSSAVRIALANSLFEMSLKFKISFADLSHSPKQTHSYIHTGFVHSLDSHFPVLHLPCSFDYFVAILLSFF